MASPPARSCWPRSTSCTGASTCTPARPSAGCSIWAWSRWSTRTTPWPTRRSGSGTTTGWPPWSPIWSRADLLVLLTDTAGLLTEDPRRTDGGSLIEEVVEIDHELERIAGGPGHRGGQRRDGLEAGRGQDRRVVGGRGGHRRRLPARRAGRGDRVGARGGHAVPAPGPPAPGPQAVDRLRRRCLGDGRGRRRGPARPGRTGPVPAARRRDLGPRRRSPSTTPSRSPVPTVPCSPRAWCARTRPRWPHGRDGGPTSCPTRPRVRWSTGTTWSCSTDA